MIKELKKSIVYFLLITLTVFTSQFNLVIEAFAAGDGTIESTVEINSTTTNGPILSNSVRYGSTVANIGDLNDDGVTDIAVASKFGPGSGASQGNVWISFLNTDGSVDSTVLIDDNTVNGPTVSNSDIFGTGIANIGDLNDDGVDDLAIGAPFDDEGGTDRGAVHILFMNTDGSVDSTVEINSSTANLPTLNDGDYFGTTIAGLDDFDGDDVEDIAVTVSGSDAGGTDRGALFILYLNTDGSIKSAVEINSATTNGPSLNDSDSFVTAANIGDLNDDGVVDLAVGATGDDEGGSNYGAVHIMFMNTDGSVDATVEINNSTANGPQSITSNSFFGNGVAGLGDFDGDDVEDIVVGEQLGDIGGTDRGLFYIFLLNTDGSVKETVEINSNTTNGPVLNNGDYYGVSTASLGDLDGNGAVDIMVGAWKDDAGGGDRGAVHIHFMTATDEIEDTTPPSISSPLPSGAQAEGTTEVTLQVTTDENATCKYGTTENTAYASISNTFSTTGGTTHTQSITGLSAGTSYTYYVRCSDSLSNVNTSDTEISFSIPASTTVDEEEEEDTPRPPSRRRNINFVTKTTEKVVQSVSTTYEKITSLYYEYLNTDQNNTTKRQEILNQIATQFSYLEMTRLNQVPQSFNIDLEFPALHPDVKRLQQFLNNNGYTVAETGPGSKGSETERFGYATRAALIRFQKANNITPAVGYFGPITRSKINSL